MRELPSGTRRTVVQRRLSMDAHMSKDKVKEAQQPDGDRDGMHIDPLPPPPRPPSNQTPSVSTMASALRPSAAVKRTVSFADIHEPSAIHYFHRDSPPTKHKRFRAATPFSSLTNLHMGNESVPISTMLLARSRSLGNLQTHMEEPFSVNGPGPSIHTTTPSTTTQRPIHTRMRRSPRRANHASDTSGSSVPRGGFVANGSELTQLIENLAHMSTRDTLPTMPPPP